jgi:hypothetical protein
MSDTIQQTAADTATEAAIDAHISGDAEKAAPLFNRATIEHQRSAAATERIEPGQWRDGHETLAPMPDAPPIATGEVDAAITKLTERGGDHAALVDNWGADIGENLAFAKAAFKEIAASDPDLIAKVEASGLGDHPAVLQFLAKQGRLSAGMMGDYTIARRNNDLTSSPMASAKPRPGGPAREEHDQLMRDNPPGSNAYKSPAIQRRVEQLSRMISGGGNVVGQGGRYA